jgi:PST family polysaccharide transporter
VGLVLAFLGFGVWSLVVQKLINPFVGVIVLWKVSDWRPGFSISKKHFLELMSFGLNMVGIRILNYINGNLDNILIGYFLGSTLLGFYTIAYKIFEIFMQLLSSVITSVAFPTFSRLQNDPDRMRRVFYQVIRYTSLISFPTFIGMSIIASELIPTFFGPQWDLSIPVLRVLAFIGILHSIFYFHESIVYAIGKPSWRLGMIGLNAISNIFAFSIAVRWGIIAVAAAYVIRGYLLSPLEVWMVRKLANVNLKTYFHQFLGPVLGSLAMALAIFGIKYQIGETIGYELQIAIYVLVGSGIYGFVIKIIDPSIWRDVYNLIRLVIPERFFPRILKL